MGRQLVATTLGPVGSYQTAAWSKPRLPHEPRVQRPRTFRFSSLKSPRNVARVNSLAHQPSRGSTPREVWLKGCVNRQVRSSPCHTLPTMCSSERAAKPSSNQIDDTEETIKESRRRVAPGRTCRPGRGLDAPGKAFAGQ